MSSSTRGSTRGVFSGDRASPSRGDSPGGAEEGGGAPSRAGGGNTVHEMPCFRWNLPGSHQQCPEGDMPQKRERQPRDVQPIPIGITGSMAETQAIVAANAAVISDKANDSDQGNPHQAISTIGTPQSPMKDFPFEIYPQSNVLLSAATILQQEEEPSARCFDEKTALTPMDLVEASRCTDDDGTISTTTQQPEMASAFPLAFLNDDLLTDDDANEGRVMDAVQAIEDAMPCKNTSCTCYKASHPDAGVKPPASDAR